MAIILPEELTLDVFCAGIALNQAVSKLGNSATVLSSSKVIPELAFLKPLPTVHTSFSKGDQLIIKDANKNAQPTEIKYEKEADGLKIFVSGSGGEFKDEDVSVLPNLNVFNLVIILGASNYESLGKLYIQNTKLFFETQTINIDNNPSNEYFGTQNLLNRLR